MRFLGRVSTLFVSLLMAVGAPSTALGQEGEKGDRVEVRFLNQRAEAAIVEEWSEDGVRLKLEGISTPVYFSWNQLDPQCAADLRLKFLGKSHPANPLDIITGYRVIPRRGVDFFPVPRIEMVEGMKVPSSDPGVLRIKSGARTWVFLREDLLYIARTRIARSSVLTEEERVLEILNRVRPKNAEGWDKVGHELIGRGMKDRGLDAFRRAEILRRPDLPEGRLYRELVRLRKALKVSNLQGEILRAQKFFLSQEIETVLEILRVVGEAVSENAMRVKIRHLGVEVRSWWQSSREEQIVWEWGRAIDSLIRSQVADRSILLSEAESYLRTNLMSDSERLIRLRFGFSPEDPDPRDLWDDRSVSDVRKHSYGAGSWLRARPDLGDPERWWKGTEVSSRVAYLKGLAIEEAYRVLWAGKKNCSTCGGKGVVYGTGSQGDVCSTCRGLKIERILFYR